MRRLSLLLLLVLVTAQPGVAQTPLELIPRHAVVGIAIRDLDELIKKGDDFIRGAALQLPVRPSQLFDLGTQFLGVQRGLDRKAAAAVVLMGDGLQHIVPILPFTDADAMAGNFGLAKGDLVPGKVLRTNRGKNDVLVRHVVRTQDHVCLGDSEKTLERVLASPSVSAALNPAQRQRFAGSDVLLHLGGKVWQNGDLRRLPQLGDDPREKDFAKQLSAALKEIDGATAGFRIDAGLDMHLLMTAPPAGQAARFFKELRGKGTPCSLAGLPEGNVLLAQAAAGGGEEQSLLTRCLGTFLIEELVAKNKVLPNFDRLTAFGVYDEIWRRVEGNRLAVYQNADETKLGLFSVIAVLDTADAPLFLRDMKTLARMALAESFAATGVDIKAEFDIAGLVRDLGSDTYSRRQAAHTRLLLIGEPALPYLARAVEAAGSDLETHRRARVLRDLIGASAAERRQKLVAKFRPLFADAKLVFAGGVEKRQGLSIDMIRAELPGLDQAGRDFYKQWLGPDWDRVRLGVVGNRIVFLLGSDTALFDAALGNLRDGTPGLASRKQLAAAGPRRLFEMHASVEGILRLVDPKAPVNAKPQLSSLALALDENWVQVDAHLPLSELRTVARKAAQLGGP
jgi:hypothetical protein